MKTVFLRALEAEDKSSALLAALREPESARDKHRFDVDPARFASVPRSPFAYWVSERLRKLFTELAPFEAEGRTAKQGLATADDFRFLRAWWAVPRVANQTRWFPFAKGGSFSPYYADVSVVVGYSRGDQVGLMAIGRYGRGADCYFRPGLTWPLRTNGLSFRVLPAGCIFGHKGPVGFWANDDGGVLLALVAVMNSQSFGLLVSLQLARTELAQSYEVGLIQKTPIPNLSVSAQSTLVKLSLRAWFLKRGLDTRTEASHAFTLPAFLQVEGDTFARRSAEWSQLVSTTEAKLAAIQAEIDAKCFDLYVIGEADRRAITEGFGRSSVDETKSDSADPDADSDSDETEADAADNLETLTAELISWAVGVAFGRFDVRLATGARALPPEPEPFDALPVCSPGMLTGDDGLPLSVAPAGYPLKLPEGGVLVDDLNHPRDLTAAVRAVFEVVFGDAADARWNEAAAILDPREQSLRNWLAKGFFEQHLKRHSKSRRKAPILWQLATASSSYSVWLYAHRIHKDTFFQVQSDLLAHKLFHEEGVQAKLEKDAGPSPSASQRKEQAAQATLLEELRTLLDEVKRIAPLWKPDLDDGVVLTMAPLFRLVPHYKPWQKELKAAWDGLATGKFDWAHLAMHLWPERVVPKCATDRSLAIAHGLEDVFWVEATEGKWKARPAPTRSVDDLVRERTSPAVKASLKSLIEAPIVGGGGAKRGRKPRAHD